MASERNRNFLIEAKQRIDDASGSMLIVLGELLREIDILKAEKIEVPHGD